ncbi:helix-turn-helix transcriptional regulator [Hyphomicrobium sp.]|uniref:helix-turn-helix domain-containing protein n=1 Tax=Hyphomicrobium sp. TaxID=82 RepID=UPI002D79A185|nr:helix-turn-helix transcriptional regulator [Hyphomicrobium sp.]HET6388315.1 helix-turn-helix transcriptional regulator [Hyphomicrobium sp.]
MGVLGPQKSIDEILGGRIRQLRETSGLSLDVLAQAAKIPVSDYAMGEQGLRRFSAAETLAIARRLGVELAELLSVLKSE